MKYNLTLSLRNFYKLAPELDLYHIMILDCLGSVCMSNHPRIIEKRLPSKDGQFFWTWVDYDYLLDVELPYLHKNKSFVTRYIEDLKKEGFIETLRPDHQKLYVRLLHKTDALISSGQSDLKEKAISPRNSSEGKAISYRNSLEGEAISPRNSSERISIDRLIDKDQENNTYMSDSTIKDDIKKVFESYIKKILPGSRLTKKASTKIKARLKEYSVDEILKAIDNFSNENWWMTHNAHRGIAWFFHTEDRIEQFINLNANDKKETLRLAKRK